MRTELVFYEFPYIKASANVFPLLAHNPACMLDFVTLNGDYK